MTVYAVGAEGREVDGVLGVADRHRDLGCLAAEGVVHREWFRIVVTGVI